MWLLALDKNQLCASLVSSPTLFLALSELHSMLREPRVRRRDCEEGDVGQGVEGNGDSGGEREEDVATVAEAVRKEEDES